MQYQKTKLQCYVSKELAHVVAVYSITHDLKKGETLRALVDLALQNPEYEPKEFGDEGRVSCTLAFEHFDETVEYRQKHALSKKTAFFKDALARGASVFLDDRGGDSYG